MVIPSMKIQEGLLVVQKGVVEGSKDDGCVTEASLVDISHTKNALRHKCNISADWTPEEQSVFEDFLTKYASTPTIVRYATIAKKMKNKSVRDVALRCKWMIKKESAKRRGKGNSSRKRKDKKVLIADSIVKSPSHLKKHPNGLPFPKHMLPVETDDGIPSRAIGGVTGDLLEQNTQMLNQVLQNFSTFKILKNVDVLYKIRENILTLNKLDEMPKLTKQMPPLHVKINEEDLAKISLIREQWSFNPKRYS